MKKDDEVFEETGEGKLMPFIVVASEPDVLSVEERREETARRYTEKRAIGVDPQSYSATYPSIQTTTSSISQPFSHGFMRHASSGESLSFNPFSHPTYPDVRQASSGEGSSLTPFSHPSYPYLRQVRSVEDSSMTLGSHTANLQTRQVSNSWGSVVTPGAYPVVGPRRALGSRHSYDEDATVCVAAIVADDSFPREKPESPVKQKMSCACKCCSCSLECKNLSARHLVSSLVALVILVALVTFPTTLILASKKAFDTSPPQNIFPDPCGPNVSC